MRKINYGLMSMLALLMCAITSCGDAERPSYDGPNYILFSDTLYWPYRTMKKSSTFLWPLQKPAAMTAR